MCNHVLASGRKCSKQPDKALCTLHAKLKRKRVSEASEGVANKKARSNSGSKSSKPASATARAKSPSRGLSVKEEKKLLTTLAKNVDNVLDSNKTTIDDMFEMNIITVLATMEREDVYDFIYMLDPDHKMDDELDGLQLILKATNMFKNMVNDACLVDYLSDKQLTNKLKRSLKGIGVKVPADPKKACKLMSSYLSNTDKLLILYKESSDPQSFWEKVSTGKVKFVKKAARWIWNVATGTLEFIGKWSVKLVKLLPTIAMYCWNNPLHCLEAIHVTEMFLCNTADPEENAKRNKKLKKLKEELDDIPAEDKKSFCKQLHTFKCYMITQAADILGRLEGNKQGDSLVRKMWERGVHLFVNVGTAYATGGGSLVALSVAQMAGLSLAGIFAATKSGQLGSELATALGSNRYGCKGNSNSKVQKVVDLVVDWV
jgi:hypothetical protein